MMTLNIDDDTADMLNQLSQRQHISQSQLLKNLLTEYLEDMADAAAADAALLELANGKNGVISMAEWEQQLNALEH
ncbi:ribbon-helix-helix protein, CopG family [Methylomonas sp. LL1]|uniref:ribbon-helix-helix domain-containing protein n=1 Tax=Methylomonas sp. LL1 TaxID=2785785 RepID=UPI0018C3F058|nr:CopG family transcriptional regulator [Methylomonas sp. LL1]QPK65355.1 ribbon-helix-helix protein, CopG family [Methylomonas sp. LL1]